VTTAYVLLKVFVDPAVLRAGLGAARIAVMWGSELGLTDAYLRLEMLEPVNVQRFSDVVSSLCGRGLQAIPGGQYAS
jgi:hypothetical protein